MANYDVFYFYNNLEFEEVYIDENIENNQGIAITEADSHFSYAGYYIDSWNTARDGSGVKYLPGDLINNPETNIFYAIWKKPPKYLVTAEQLETVADAIRENCTFTDTKLSYPWGFIEGIENYAEQYLADFLNGEINNIKLNLSVIFARTFYYNNNIISVDFPSCKTINSEAFGYCSNLTTVNFPECTIIYSSAFVQCFNLTTISFPLCQNIKNYAFNYCSNLISINFPACTYIESTAFYNCVRLSTANFPVCKSINNRAFAYCNYLATINFPQCTRIGQSAFYNCVRLSTANFPMCTSLAASAFYNCTSLIDVNFPMCSIIWYDAFYNCRNLIEANFPMCQTIYGYAFSFCSNLTTIKFPSCTQIDYYVFSSCYRLLSAFFLGSSIPSLAYSTAFSSTPIANFTSYTNGEYGSIFVRASMLEEFKSATNWTYFSDRIVGLTDEEIANL